MKKIPIHIEAALRCTWMAALCYILSVSGWDQVVPPSLSYFIGMQGSMWALMFPKLCYGIGAVVPIILLQFLTSLALVTMLLAAATVSDALMVVVFSIMAISLTGLYFGPSFDKTLGYLNLLLYLPAWMSLNLRPLVQSGFTVMVPVLDGTAGAGLLPPDDSYDFVGLALSEMCRQEGQAADCWQTATIVDDNNNTFSGTYEIQIPSDSSDVFGGQTAYVTVMLPEQESVEIHIPGGMWVVKGLWTWQGIDNPLAVHRNFMIAICWIMVCYVISLLTPPWRTARARLSRHVVPNALQIMANATSTVEQQQDVAAEESTTAVEAEAGEEASSSTSAETIRDVRSDLIAIWKVVEGGSNAGLTTYEPRLCRAPFEYLVPPLKNLLLQTESSILTFLIQPDAEILHPHQHHDNDEGGDDQTTESDLQNTHALLKASAEALTTMDASTLTSMKEGISEDAFFGGADESPSRFLLHRASKLRQVSLEWIQVMQKPLPTPIKQIPRNLCKTYKPWILSPIMGMKRVPALLVIPVKPKNWRSIDPQSRGCWKFLWAIKFALGFIALFVMTVYWDDYAAYAIPVGTSPSEDLFSGWHLAAYAFAYRPTAEGTVKKGLQRLVGTCVGGFSAWLAIIVCSGSYAEHAEVNPYALVAWLTITFAIVAYFSVEKGPAAHQGVSPDHGFFGVYAVFTQALITLQYYSGSESRDSLYVHKSHYRYYISHWTNIRILVQTANRIMATLTGVLMAIVVAFIPPLLFGQALRSIHDYDEALEEEWDALLEQATQRSGGHDTGDDNGKNATNFTKAVQAACEQSSLQRRRAIFLIKDTGSLQALPIFRLNPAYMPMVEEMAVTESLIWHFLELLDFAPIRSEDKSLMSSFGNVSEASMEVINKSDETPHNVHVSTARKIHNRLVAHREAIAKLK